jgi:hypothetical protein
LWAFLFFVYVSMMLATSLKAGIVAAQATEAAWNIAYILLPVLTAFASFFFAPIVHGPNDPDRDDEDPLGAMSIRSDRLFAAFLLTFMVHAIVMAYFLLFLIAPNFADEMRQTQTYESALSGGLKLMVLLFSLAVAPVGWLLDPKKPVAIPAKQPQSTSP